LEGTIIAMIDEEAALYAINSVWITIKVVTKFMSEINFYNSPKQVSILEIGLGTTVKFG